jgi:formylglycine-generating enzyme required for sulfatase activity
MAEIEIRRTHEELPDHNIRFGIRVTNVSDAVIFGVEVILDYNESLFALEGSKVQNLGEIPPAGERTVEFILKPRSCIHKEEIGATVRYKDYHNKRHTEDMRPLEVHCVRPYLQEKAMREGEFIELARSLDQRAEGFTFSGIGVPELTAFLKTSCARRLYLISEYNVEGTVILNFAGESKGEKACYLLTVVIKPSREYTQIVFRAYSDKPYGLSGFLTETAESLRHLVGAVQSAREIGIIKHEQVINIIDSVVQRTTFAAGGEGVPSVTIKDSVVQRAEIKADEEVKRRRREEEERESLRREEERKEQDRKAREEAEKREREQKEQERKRQEQERLRKEEEEKKAREESEKRKREEQERLRREEKEREERERKTREEQERLRKEAEEQKARERKAREEAEKKKREKEKARQEAERLKREQEAQERKRQEQEHERLEQQRKERELLQEKKAREIRARAREAVKPPETEKGASRTKIFAVIIVLGAALLGYWGFTALSHDGTQPGSPAALPTPIATPSPTPAVTPTPKPADFTNSIGMEFVLIPAGAFEMGSPSNEAGRDDDDGPIHQVTIKNAFYMGKYEVTQEQWRAVMGDNPSYFTGNDNLPVEQVSWDDVQEFIRKLNAKEGTDKYRLPSEAEWEYACRAGTTTRYSFGDSESRLGEYAWYTDNSGSKTHPVGQKKPNPWGLYDMHGNVWEWVLDGTVYFSSEITRFLRELLLLIILMNW